MQAWSPSSTVPGWDSWLSAGLNALSFLSMTPLCMAEAAPTGLNLYRSVKHSAVYPKVLFSLESADTMSRKSNITNLFCFTGLLLAEEVSVLPAAGDVHCWWCGVSLCSLHQERCFLFIAYFSQSQWSDPDGNHLFGSVWTKPHPLGKFPSVSLQAWQKFGSIVEFLALQLSNNLFQHSGFALGLNFRKYSGQSSLYTNCFFFFYINMKIKQM